MGKGLMGAGIAMGALVLGMVVGAGQADNKPPATQPTTATTAAAPTIHTVKKGPLSLEVSAEGTLQPVDPFEVKLKMKAYAGTLNVARAAAPWAEVKKDDVLLEIDPQEFNWALTATQAAAATARANLAKAESDAQLGDKGDALAMRMQQDALKRAEDAVGWWEKVDGPQMLLSEDLALKQVKDSLTDQADELDQLKKMYKSEELTNATADIVVKRALRRYEQTQVMVKMSEERTDKSKKVDYPAARQRVLDARDQARQAMAALKAGQEQSRVLRAGALSSARIAAEQAENKLKDMLTDQALLTIKAPVSGIVMYTQASEGELRPLHVGDKLAVGSVPMKVFAPGKMKLELPLSDQQAFWIEPGTRAKVIPAAFPAITYQGTCSAPVAMPRSQPPGVSFVLTITLPDVDARLLPGMKANVRIEAGKVDEALIVPLTAVSDGQVTVKTASGQEKRTVVLGRSDGQNVEVKSGLKEGEQVLIGARK